MAIIGWLTDDSMVWTTQIRLQRNRREQVYPGDTIEERDIILHVLSREGRRCRLWRGC